MYFIVTVIIRFVQRAANLPAAGSLSVGIRYHPLFQIRPYHKEVIPRLFSYWCLHLSSTASGRYQRSGLIRGLIWKHRPCLLTYCSHIYQSNMNSQSQGSFTQ